MMRLKPFLSIGRHEAAALIEFASDIEDPGFPLSGYLAGKERGGFHVCRLETMWAKAFRVKHAIACNSATSGLLAASFAVGLNEKHSFICPAMTMSATCAAPMFTGATPLFCDVSDRDFGLAPGLPMPDNTRVIFTTNLFGHPSQLARNEWYVGKIDPVYLIEDNSQSPFAMANGRYAGTFGSIGVFSLNVHKPLQCGEGGIVVTNDDDLAAKTRRFINHGEHGSSSIGLNLRMPEVCAALALVQLARGPEIIAGRRQQAEAILEEIGLCDFPGSALRLPAANPDCEHSWYAIPFLVERNRAAFCEVLRSHGVPIVEGYVPPLYRLPAFARHARPCPVAEDLHDRRLFYFENCAWDPTQEQIVEIGKAFRQAAKMVSTA
jgi:perosamine synthetase